MHLVLELETENAPPTSAQKQGEVLLQQIVPHITYMSIFHWLQEVLKKPQLAAF